MKIIGWPEILLWFVWLKIWYNTAASSDLKGSKSLVGSDMYVLKSYKSVCAIIPMFCFDVNMKITFIYTYYNSVLSTREISSGFEWSFSVCLTMKFKRKTWHRNNNSAIFTPKSFVLVGDVSDQLLVSVRICSFTLQRFALYKSICIWSFQPL